MQEQQQNNGRGAMSFLKVWAVTLYLPLRRGMGRDHVGFSVLFGFFLIFVISQYARAPGLMWLCVVNVIAWFCERCAQETRRWKGIREHTEYEGRSWLLEWIFRDEDLAKQLGEPLLCFFVGWLIYRFTSQPNAATYFWYGGVILAVWQSFGREQERRAVDQMHNAMIEHQHYISKMRRRF